jgi:DNA-binding GntR family transcriptional regulator
MSESEGTSATDVGRGGRRRESQSVSAVHDRIREAILYGQLEAGAAIPQHVLAEQFEAGRTPLREALRMLQREGLVVAEPNFPVRIATLSANAYEELYVRRISLEAVAIRIAVPLLTSDDFADLEAAMARMGHYQEVADERAFRDPHHAFHHRLIAAAGSNISEEVDTLADHSERYRLAFGTYGGGIDRGREHRRILDAAKKGDPDLAADALGAHYAHTASLVFSVLDPGRDVERLRVVLRTVAPGAEEALAGGTESS